MGAIPPIQGIEEITVATPIPPEIMPVRAPSNATTSAQIAAREIPTASQPLPEAQTTSVSGTPREVIARNVTQQTSGSDSFVRTASASAGFRALPATTSVSGTPDQNRAQPLNGGTISAEAPTNAVARSSSVSGGSQSVQAAQSASVSGGTEAGAGSHSVSGTGNQVQAQQTAGAANLSRTLGELESNAYTSLARGDLDAAIGYQTQFAQSARNLGRLNPDLMGGQLLNSYYKNLQTMSIALVQQDQRSAALEAQNDDLIRSLQIEVIPPPPEPLPEPLGGLVNGLLATGALPTPAARQTPVTVDTLQQLAQAAYAAQDAQLAFELSRQAEVRATTQAYEAYLEAEAYARNANLETPLALIQQAGPMMTAQRSRTAVEQTGIPVASYIPITGTDINNIHNKDPRRRIDMNPMRVEAVRAMPTSDHDARDYEDEAGDQNQRRQKRRREQQQRKKRPRPVL